MVKMMEGVMMGIDDNEANDENDGYDYDDVILPDHLWWSVQRLEHSSAFSTGPSPEQNLNIDIEIEIDVEIEIDIDIEIDIEMSVI